MKKELNEKIAILVQQVIPEITKIRRAIHANPELAGEEYETSRLVREELAKSPAIEVKAPFVATDVIALLYGKGPGKNVTLRADMDALPMEEATLLPYASRNPGKMHGCGHDGHTACLLGAAKVLAQLQDEFEGSIRFAFQPGEETGGHAQYLVGAGALDEPPPSACYALHAHSTVVPGLVKTMSGVLMSGITEYRIELTGMSSIRSEPEKAVDPIAAMAQLVLQLNMLISTKVSPLDNAILDVKNVHAFNPAGDAPGKAVVEGHIRYLKENTRDVLRKSIVNILEGLKHSYGVEYTHSFREDYKINSNDPWCVELLRKITEETYGKEMFRYMEQPSMGSEDFCYFLEKAPGAFFNLGNGVDRAYCHNPKFDFNDEALSYGITLFVKLALETLEEKNRS